MPQSTEQTLPPTTARVRISLGRLRRNVRRLQQRARPAEIMAVIKADAYGHGADKVAPLLSASGVSHFAVARVEEAISLRESGILDDILVLGAPLRSHLRRYVNYDLGITVASEATARDVAEFSNPPRTMRVHVKIDTGMGRLGLEPGQARDVIARLRAAPHVEIAGLWTHLAHAGSAEADDFTSGQIRDFLSALSDVEHPLPPLHVANSSAVIRQLVDLPAGPPLLARVGLALFGLAETPDLSAAIGLEPAMQLISLVTHTKEVLPGTPISYGRTWHAPTRTCIATVGAGYADGYFRLLSNRATVSIKGTRYPVVGAVCMDMFMVNVGPPGRTDPVTRGAPVCLFGPGGPSAYEVAAWAETIPYEVCCNVSERVPREYVDEFNKYVNI